MLNNMKYTDAFLNKKINKQLFPERKRRHETAPWTMKTWYR